jgi:proteic killer suppression protein
MIRTFKCKYTEKLFNDIYVSKFQSIERIARMKLEILNSVMYVESLKVPPGNRLEKLSGNRLGQYSIRINDQWRICFKWHENDAYDVEILDYH